MKMTCPKCKHAWEQELQPGVKSHVVCPQCKASFVTMSKAKGSPTILQNPPRAKPAIAPPEVTQSFLGLLKLIHHNQMLSQDTVQELLKRQPEMTTFRDVFELLVNENHVNAAEFDAFRVLLENPKIQELLMIIQLQEKKGPVILGGKVHASSKEKDKMRTLLDDEDSVAIEEGLATLQDDDDMEMPSEISAKMASNAQNKKGMPSGPGSTLPEEFPEVKVSVNKDTEATRLLKQQPIKPPKKDEMITMLESDLEIAANLESMETHIEEGDAENQDTFFQEGAQENLKTDADGEDQSIESPKECGQELLKLLRKRNAVRLFAQYEIEREIARNDTAVVFFVEQFQDPFCLKVFFYEDEAFKEKKFKEIKNKIKVIQNIRHANIVEVMDMDFFNEVPYLLMKRNLSSSLDRLSDFTPQQLFSWIHVAAQTIHAVHKKGVIHGNLKPRNILFDQKSNRVYVTDFALFGGLMGDLEKLDKINPYALAYLPPELLQGKPSGELAPNVDIYSLGVILYEALAGEPPFKGDNVAKITYNKMNKEPQSLVDRIRLDPNYNQFVQNCMNADVTLRYKEFTPFLEDLEKVLKEKPIKPLKKGGIFGFRS